MFMSVYIMPCPFGETGTDICMLLAMSTSGMLLGIAGMVMLPGISAWTMSW